MSAPEIDIGALSDISEEAATELLVAAADHVVALLDALPETQSEAMVKRPMLVAVHAILQHLDCRAEERQLQQTAMIEALHDLRESIDFLAARSDGEAVPVPTAGESERMLGVLKADWLRQYPEHTEEQYLDAMRRFELLAGL